MWRTGLVAPRHVGSSQTRARTRVPCIGRRILNHCATREALTCVFKLYSQYCWGRWSLGPVCVSTCACAGDLSASHALHHGVVRGTPAWPRRRLQGPCPLPLQARLQRLLHRAAGAPVCREEPEGHGPPSAQPAGAPSSSAQGRRHCAVRPALLPQLKPQVDEFRGFSPDVSRTLVLCVLFKHKVELSALSSSRFSGLAHSDQRGSACLRAFLKRAESL